MSRNQEIFSFRNSRLRFAFLCTQPKEERKKKLLKYLLRRSHFKVFSEKLPALSGHLLLFRNIRKATFIFIRWAVDKSVAFLKIFLQFPALLA